MTASAFPYPSGGATMSVRPAAIALPSPDKDHRCQTCGDKITYAQMYVVLPPESAERIQFLCETCVDGEADKQDRMAQHERESRAAMNGCGAMLMVAVVCLVLWCSLIAMIGSLAGGARP